MENLVIIGAGCAGLTAAVYAARANLKPLVFAGPTPGGLITTTGVVENFPGFPEGVEGFDLVSKIQAQAERFGARVEFSEVESVDLSMKPFQLKVEGQTIQTTALIVATGAAHRHLGLESEAKLERKGVTYCATCDGALPIFRNQPLVVVGGGDSACEEALHLTQFGSMVYLIHRRDTLRASKIMADRVLCNPKIKPVWDSVVTDVLDVTQGKVTGIRVKNVKTNEETTIPCAGVFVAIGHAPNNSLFDGQLEMDAAGYILRRNGTTETNIPGVFVAGDCADPRYRQAITAAAMGAQAAIDAGRWIGENS
ncbi:MAG: thioredoxin-disulfide reductase [Verrucomicrobia bacterium]|nr:thioredoxin-disulfide reductase [Verrucomicrobiota bacterium]MBR5690464.1 thioredoxin-disulfide reductase [Verrucomicrobiota bacterium]MBR6464245.1 thioredoxin-disulfide reductase [Verrucomicrobiota bacterium]